MKELKTSLISCVGTSDPIARQRDGALLHIARHEKPDQIILIYSEELAPKHPDILASIAAIDDNYQPEIIKHDRYLTDVARYDRVYEQLSTILPEYIDDKHLPLLNLSSGTPQMTSALFTLNQILEWEARMVQVDMPFELRRDREIRTFEDPSKEINQNHDQQNPLENRVNEENIQKFPQTLQIRTLIRLITEKDYYGALEIIDDIKSLPNKKFIRATLKDTVDNLHFQKVPQKMIEMGYDSTVNKVIHSYLMITKEYESGNYAEVLIRMKSLTEFICAYYLEEQLPTYFNRRGTMLFLNEAAAPELFEALKNSSIARLADGTDEVDVDHPSIFSEQNYLNLNYYIEIFRFTKLNANILRGLNRINEINGMRNAIAHDLKAIQSGSLKNLRSAYRSLTHIVKEVYDVEPQMLNYYDDLSEELVARIRG